MCMYTSLCMCGIHGYLSICQTFKSNSLPILHHILKPCALICSHGNQFQGPKEAQADVLRYTRGLTQG